MSELGMVLALLACAIVMFAINKPRMDAVALLVMTIMPLLGLVTVKDALSGFSDPNVVLIAALFIIGEGLVRTGVAQRLGDMLIEKAGKSETRLLVLLMVMVAGIGSVMSSTGVVAIFIPVVLRVAHNANLLPGHLMMPLSVAALMSGMMTLVGTPPNLVVNAELLRHGIEGFHFFSFTPFGVPLLVLGVIYMIFARKMLSHHRLDDDHPHKRPRLSDWVLEYGLAEREYRLRVTANSPLVGKRLEELNLRSSSGVNIVAVERMARLGHHIVRPEAKTELHVGDVIYLDAVGNHADVESVMRQFHLQRLPMSGVYFSDRSQEIGMVEVMVPPTSKLCGKTLVESGFRTNFKLNVVGLRRGITPLKDSLLQEKIKAGDTLLLIGPWKAIRAIQGDLTQMVVLNLPAELDDVAPAARKASFALLSLGVMIALMVSGVVPNVLAVLIGCLMMGLFKCVDFNSSYKSIHWQSIVLIAGMMPFSVALQRTGGVDIAADFLLNAIGPANPHMVLAGLFLVTALFGLFISNTATAVLMAPLAVAVANNLGASPYPFAMIVALAASSAFMTPVSSPVNTLVMGPGNYTFMDFVKVGVPFTILCMIVCVFWVPVLLPF